jgi:hypothetical protein
LREYNIYQLYYPGRYLEILFYIAGGLCDSGESIPLTCPEIMEKICAPAVG